MSPEMLAVRCTSGLGNDAVVAHDDVPVALRDAEGTKRLIVSRAGDEGSRTVISDGPREAVAGDDQITALVEVRLHIHGQDDRTLRLALVCNAEVGCRSLPGCEGLVADILVPAGPAGGYRWSRRCEGGCIGRQGGGCLPCSGGS